MEMAKPRGVRKAIIPAAGHGTRMLPASRAVRKELFPIVDCDGRIKPAIQIIVEEAVESGIQEICIVVSPGGQEVFQEYFSEPDTWLRDLGDDKPQISDAIHHLPELGRRLSYVVQREQDGFGDAVLQGRDWAGGEPVLVMLGDHVYMSRTDRRCAAQLMDIFAAYQQPVSTVIQRPEQDLRLFGTVYGTPVGTGPPVYSVTRMKEKPETELAAKDFKVASLPSDRHLCFFGLHIMTNNIFECLTDLKIEQNVTDTELQFTSAQALLMNRRPDFAVEIEGRPFDIGIPEGYVETVEAFAAAGLAGQR